MQGPYPEIVKHPELKDMRTAADTLENLLNLLAIDVANSELLTWQMVKERYPYTGLGELALIDIEDQKRIVHTSGQHEHIGLWEFHIGLIYLHWGEPRQALPYFATAQRYWMLVNNTAAAYLASFAQGYTQQFDRLYAAAMANFLRIQHSLDQKQRPFFRKVSKTFTTEMKTAVAKATTDLRRLSSQLSYIRPGNIEEIFTASVQPTQEANQKGKEGSPIPGHLIMDEQLIWYRIDRSHTDDFLPDIEADDWVLVRKSTKNEIVSQHNLIVINAANLNSSIRLINTQANAAKVNTRIFLGQISRASRTFTRDKDGNIQISNVQISEQQQMQVDYKNIFGVVLGFWSSNVNA